MAYCLLATENLVPSFSVTVNVTNEGVIGICPVGTSIEIWPAARLSTNTVDSCRTAMGFQQVPGTERHPFIYDNNNILHNWNKTF